MFVFDGCEKYILTNSSIKGQFEPFSTERGKLPSFNVYFKDYKMLYNYNLKEIQTIGDYTFYRDRNNSFWISFCNSFLFLNNTFDSAEIFISKVSDNDISYVLSYLLMQAYMYRLVTTGNFMIHSASVVYNNDAIMFCGLSGAGKSTQANLWKKYLNCYILNYDKPCIINDNDTIYAHGSPWSGKEHVIRNEYVHLKAIAYVVQSKSNSLRKLSKAEAMSHIYLHNYVYPITSQIEKNYISAISNVADRIPVYELSCTISEEAVELLFNELYNDVKYQEIKKEFVMKYKVKKCFEMKRIADEYIVIPRGAIALDFKASVVFNEAGAFLWNKLRNFIDETSLATDLQAEYNIDENTAKSDTKDFLDKMLKNGLLDTIEE